MSFNIYEKAKEKMIIAAHRGAPAGNIPCNTLPAYRAALMQGADMIEIDVDMSADGELFIFHPYMESPHLGASVRISKMQASEVRALRYVNYDRTPTQFSIASFDDFLEQFKGRCFINIDKFWDNPEKIYEAVKKHNMLDQILVKSKLSKNVVRVLEGLCPELAFIPIVSEEFHMHEALKKMNINYLGAEVLFKKDDSYFASNEFIDMMHNDGKLVWANAIIYNYKEQLSGGHSDDTALTVSEDYGWGWLADRGFDFIQTDWTMMLIDYLKKTNKY